MAGAGMTLWARELDRPSGDFFKAFAAAAGEGDDPPALAREAVLRLAPAVDWAGYLPHLPHGLLGLQAAFRLQPLLPESSFLRLLATQLHGFAHEARSVNGHGLGAIGPGSGHWGNLHMALVGHRPAIAWGEARTVERVEPEHFRLLETWVEADMANIGHKSVVARLLGELWTALGDPGETGRILLAVSAWIAASEPHDTFWHDRGAARLVGAPPVPFQAAGQPPESHAVQVREICDVGLVELLDRFATRVRSRLASGDLLAALALAAAEKQLDARRDLEGKTLWNFVVLAALAKRTAQEGQGVPESWVQAAALVNLFPTGEEEDRPRPAAPRQPVADPAAGLVDAILDGEPLQAMFLARDLLGRGGPEAVLRALAEAASGNDPAFNYSHQALAVAAGADLMPHLPPHAQEAVLVALAKALGNAQGCSDLGRLADSALRAAAGRPQPN